MKVNNETKVYDILKKSKEVQKIFNKYKMDCLSCKGISQDTIGHIVNNYGLDSKKFISEINKALEKK